MIKRTLITLCLAGSLAGCSAGSNFEWSDVRQLRVDMTESQVKQLLGPPNRVATIDDRAVWTWVNVDGWKGQSEFVSVSFRSGKVLRVPKIPAEY